MPAIAFGLGSNKKSVKSGPVSLKRKAAFEIDAEDDETTTNDQALEPQKPVLKRKALELSEAYGDDSLSPAKYSNLSALRNAKLQNEAASKLDSSVYDYDAVYETFTAKDKPTKHENGDTTVPKYMSNLLASAETRKRDQLRATEKQLQREREQEGDEFAEKEQFVTTAYKKRQEENRQLEEQEKLREEAENERRRQGGGMTAFHKTVLAKDEERFKAVEAAQQEARSYNDVDQTTTSQKQDMLPHEDHIAAELKEKGANIITNDDGEIVDKRQLLTAGLNIVPKPANHSTSNQNIQDKRLNHHKSSKPSEARLSQRERQSRMVEKQIEEMEARQKEAEVAECQAQEDKNKSKLTDNDKLGAKERYLQRKREREQKAKT